MPHLSLLIGALLWQRGPGAFVTESSLSPVLPATIDRLTGGTAEKRSKKNKEKRKEGNIYKLYTKGKRYHQQGKISSGSNLVGC